MDEFDRTKVYENAQKKKKKAIIIAIVVCIVLIILLACLVLFYQYRDSKTFKLFIDGKKVTCSEDFMITDNNGNCYVKAKELASLIGWTYQNGEFGSYTEDVSSGYLQNEYEASSFKSGSSTLKKYIQLSTSVIAPSDDDSEENFIKVNSENGTLESMELELPVITYNNQIYIPFSHINDICNCYGTYESFQMNIYEQNYLMNVASQNAYNYGYSNISGVYENIRALAYGMMVVSKNENYGVVSLFNGEQVLGFKYSDIVFNQNVKEFFVKGTGIDKDTVGLIGVDGNVIISPKAYDNISVLSDELGLYLIEKDGKYGVLNRQGDIIVYDEFDSIGLSEEIAQEYGYTSEDNRYLIYNKAIIVENDGMYGLYNLEGREILPVSYLGFGCIVNSSNKISNDDKSNKNDNNTNTTQKRNDRDDGIQNVLKMETEVEVNGEIIEVEGIVVESDNLGTSLYGVFDVNSEKLIIPCGCERMYSKTKSGVVTNYMQFQGEELEFSSYIEQQKNNLYFGNSERTETN